MSGNVRKKGGRTDTDALVAQLACGDTIAAAAGACDICERTVYRYLKVEVFRQRVREARRELVSQAGGRLSSYSAPAAEKLNLLLTSNNENVVLGAARSILDQVIKIREHDDLAEQIRQLRERLDKAGVPPA